MFAELRDDDTGRPGLPRYVERELAEYLRCGFLAHGFARVRCQACADELVVAFSCKRRGICPSCTARRMADTAAHLVDRVLLRAPYRQWVFTVPKPLRLRREPADDPIEDREHVGDMKRAVNELKSAERRAAQAPDEVFEIGQDANAPIRDGTKNARNPEGDRMQSFDIAVKKGDAVVKSIEVTTVGVPVKNASDLTDGVRHATGKAAGRIIEGKPIPGELEAEIKIDLFQGSENKGTGTVQYDGAGNYKYTVDNGKVPKKFGGKANPGNVFDDFAKALPGVANSEKLAVVTIVDSSDKVVATMERQGESWIWTDKPKGTP